MKATTQEAIADRQAVLDAFREAENNIGKNHTAVESAKRKAKAALHAHNQMLQKRRTALSEEDLAIMIDAGDALDFVLKALEQIKTPSIDQAKDYSLDSCDERIKEAANYKVSQTELEKLLQEKVDRGESLNQHLVGGSFAMRRAAKAVMKKVKNT